MGEENNSCESDEKLLQLHEKLREEMGTHYQLHNKQITVGLTVFILLFGYGFMSENIAFILLLPFLLGIIFIISAMSVNRVFFLAKSIADLEMEISEPGSKFRYESEYGGAFGEQRKMPLIKLESNNTIIKKISKERNISIIPYYLTILLFILAYSFTVVFSVVYIPVLQSIKLVVDDTQLRSQLPSAPNIDILGYIVSADSLILAIIYIIFSILLFIVGLTTYRTVTELESDHEEKLNRES